jgi:hypothetical protein
MVIGSRAVQLLLMQNLKQLKIPGIGRSQRNQ